MKISNAQELEIAIKDLEAKKELQKLALSDQLHLTTESIKPMNLLKSAVSKIGPSDVVGAVIKTAGSVGIGLLTNKLTRANAAASKGKKVINSIVSIAATSAVVNHVDKIKAYGTAVFNNLLRSKKNKP